MGHLRLFRRVMHRESPASHLLRGSSYSARARKGGCRSNLPRLWHKQVVSLVQIALEKAWDDIARLFLVTPGDSSNGGIASEPLPLQIK